MSKNISELALLGQLKFSESMGMSQQLIVVVNEMGKIPVITIQIYKINPTSEPNETRILFLQLFSLWRIAA